MLRRRNLLLLAALVSLPATRVASASGDPSLSVVKVADVKKPFAFQLKSGAGEPLCTSEGFKSERKALKAAKAAQTPGKALKNYIFQKSTGATGERHYWDLKDAKKKKVLCTSEKVEDFGKAEHTAGVATHAFGAVVVK